MRFIPLAMKNTPYGQPSARPTGNRTPLYARAVPRVPGRHGKRLACGALIDNLVERGLDPAAPRLFIIDGSKALSKAIRATFGRDAAIQRCQIHKARNIMDACPSRCTRKVRHVLRQA